VGFLEPAAANFSLLPGAAGAVGTAAADAACALAYPGSRAELDMLVLWKAALIGHLPPASPAFAYWASSASDIPLFKSGGPGGNFMPRISDCDNWSNNVTGPAPYVKVGSGPGITDAYVGFNFCSNNGLAVACFCRLLRNPYRIRTNECTRAYSRRKAIHKARCDANREHRPKILR
jgi:hypothetical protein